MQEGGSYFPPGSQKPKKTVETLLPEKKRSWKSLLHVGRPQFLKTGKATLAFTIGSLFTLLAPLRAIAGSLSISVAFTVIFMWVSRYKTMDVLSVSTGMLLDP